MTATNFRERRGLIVPDAHWPYVDLNAWALALRVGRFVGAEWIIVLGDAFDFYQVSSHDKSPDRAGRLVDDLKSAMRGLDDLDALRAEECHFIAGNHENRLNKYIERAAPALHGLPGLSVPEILSLSSRGWSFTPYGGELQFGSLRLTHDYDKCGKQSLPHAADVTDTDTVIGHTHRIGEHVSTSRKTGETIRALSFGWLGDFDAIDYRKRAVARREWGHGCGVGWTRPDGSVRLEAVRFLNGRARVDGMVV